MSLSLSLSWFRGRDEGWVTCQLSSCWRWLCQQNFFNLHSPPTQGAPLTNFTSVSPSVPLSSPSLCLLQPSLPVSWEPKGSDLPLNGGLQPPKFSDLRVKLLLVHVANHFSQGNLSFSSWHSVFMNKKTDFAELQKQELCSLLVNWAFFWMKTAATHNT